MREVHEYVEIVRPSAREGLDGASAAPPRAIVTCEHASERLPDRWHFPDADARLRGTHWAYDLGAADLAVALAEELETVAVLARFSRLLADPNRPVDSPDLFRTEAEGGPVALNQAIDQAERQRRLCAWHAYHDAVDREVSTSLAPVVFAMHTFTPIYEGARRSVEVGVLFDAEEALAERLRAVLADAGFAVAMNEPYSGRLGLMYSVERHAKRYGRRPIELEVRQDLAVDARVRARVVAASAEALRALP